MRRARRCSTPSRSASRRSGGWARRGWEFASCEIDLRPGGAYRFVSRTPQGYEIDNGGTCDEIVAPERLVTTQDAGAGRTRHTLVLTEDGGRTTMTYAVEYPIEMRDAAAAMTEPMDAGTTSSPSTGEPSPDRVQRFRAFQICSGG